MPQRIQRQRTKGWRMPNGAIYVGRPTRFGNPWTVGQVACGCRSVGECNHNSMRCDTAEEAVRMYRWWIDQWKPARREELKVLRGMDLACWCPLDQPCHADVLLEVANQ
jgi:hypothetical protein